MNTRISKVKHVVSMISGCSLGPFWQPYEAVVPLWQPLGYLLGPFWLAFPASARFELPGEAFQLHFCDLGWFLVPSLCDRVSFSYNLEELLEVVRLLLCVLFSSPSFPSYLSSSSFSSSCLLAGYLERASVAKRSEAAAFLFLFLLLWRDGWLDG